MNVLLLKISIHGNNNTRRQCYFMHCFGASMLDQKRASRAEGPRQNCIEEVVFLEIVKVE